MKKTLETFFNAQSRYVDTLEQDYAKLMHKYKKLKDTLRDALRTIEEDMTPRERNEIRDRIIQALGHAERKELTP